MIQTTNNTYLKEKTPTYSTSNCIYSVMMIFLGRLLLFIVFTDLVQSFQPQGLTIHARRPYYNTRSYSVRNHEDNIEPYIGPMSSLADMEGGIAISENALQVLVGPSLVAPGKGLFLSIFNEDIESDDVVEEVVIPHGTPLCGYGRGYFTSEETGDKSVSFTFTSDTVVFFEKKLMGINDAINMAFSKEERDVLLQKPTNEFLWGHIVELDDQGTGEVTSIRPDEDFDARIFIPDEENENMYGAPNVGMYANDLAYDPDDLSEEAYLRKSNENNILQLIWRLAKDEKTGLLVPTWPVVIARKDFRLVNTVPMEVGLQYGFLYWDSFKGHPHE